MHARIILADVLISLSGVVGLYGYVPYVRNLLKPGNGIQRNAWLIWSVEYCFLTIVQVVRGPWLAAVLPALQLLGTLTVTGLGFTGYGNNERPTRNELFTLLLTMSAMVLWFFTENPAYALLLLIGVESIGIVLVMLAAYRRPGVETLGLWWCCMLSGALSAASLATHQTSNPTVYAYAALLVLGGASVIMADELGAWRARQLCSVPELSRREVDRVEGAMMAEAAALAALRPSRTLFIRYSGSCSIVALAACGSSAEREWYCFGNRQHTFVPREF